MAAERKRLRREAWQAIALNSWSYFGGEIPDVLDDEQKRRLSSE